MIKKQIAFIILLLAVFMVACSPEQNPNPEINGNEAGSSSEDERIIATTVALVEIMDALELDLVGIPTSYKDLPKRYADAQEVGMAAEPDMEIIRSLQPTNVLSVTTLEGEFNLKPVFENAGVPITFIDMESVEGMYEGISSLGEKFNRTEQAEAMIDSFEEKLNEIEETVVEKESPSVLILLGIPGSYRHATESSYIGELEKRAGGINVINGHDAEYVSANTENLQQSNPDVILRAAHGMPDSVVEMFDKEFAENDIWKHFKAVQDDRVYDLEETLFGTTANLAVPEALEELLDMLYED